jgi:starvation-inducible DNA-binding protein
MEPHIGIKPADLAEVSHSLNALLADEFLLTLKTRNAHWNVDGPDFHEKHVFFEEQYKQLDQIMDDVAERIRSLGHYAPATMNEYLELTHLTEKRSQNNDGKGFVKDLLEDHESVIVYLHENINRFANTFHDPGTSDFIAAIMETHEKMAWMLREHLQ